MAAYIYTWNPEKWRWADLQDAIYQVNNGEDYEMFWSCGNTKRIQPGDLFFLIKVGTKPRGIIGCGYVSSAPYDRPHWDESKRAAGEVAPRTNLLFKALSEKPIFSTEELERRFPEQLWSPQASGISVKDEIADKLLAEILSNEDLRFKPLTPEAVRKYAEGRPKTVTTKTYDRSPGAREACIEHHGYNCAVCGFNFGKEYGSIGEGFIEVHHLRQIADQGEEYLVDPVNDLRPVCANCHRMLHKVRPPLSIEALIEKIRSR